eukprot:764529-Hanusia_phi.AAC.6
MGQTLQALRFWASVYLPGSQAGEEEGGKARGKERDAVYHELTQAIHDALTCDLAHVVGVAVLLKVDVHHQLPVEISSADPYRAFIIQKERVILSASKRDDFSLDPVAEADLQQSPSLEHVLKQLTSVCLSEPQMLRSDFDVSEVDGVRADDRVRRRGEP